MGKRNGKRIAIAGGSGFFGVSLSKQFVEAGADATIVSRSVPRVVGAWKYRVWDGRTIGNWTEGIDGAEAVVSVAGRTVDYIMSPDRCDEILGSRVEPTRCDR